MMNLLNGIAFLGTQELLIIGALVLLVFGGAKIPQLMRGLGRGVGEFQTGLTEGKKLMESGIRDATKSDEEPESK